MFIKNKPIQRIATLFLTLTVLFTSINLTPLITHAADGVNGELAVTNKQNISGSGGWADIRQGYRFYIIDRSCTRQSDIYDFYYEVPAEVGVYYINTRWEPVTTYNGTQTYWHTYPISDLANTWCQGSINASDILNIPPMFITSKDARYVNGDEFQYWFIGTVSGNTQLNTPIGGTTGNTGGGSSFISGNPNQGITEKTPAQIQQEQAEKKQDALNKAAGMQTILSTYNGIQHCASYYNNNVYFNKHNRRINNSIGILASTFKTYAKEGKKRGLTDTEAKAYASHFVYQALASGYPDDVKAWITCVIEKSAYFNSSNEVCFSSEIKSNTGISKLAKLTLPQTEELGLITIDPLLLNQNIPLAGETEYPADKMLTQENGIKVYNFNVDVDKNGTINAMDALHYEIDDIYQYYLVVEPIAWINVFIDGDHHEALRSYGSYYNLLNKYNELGNDSASGMHASYIKELGKNSLVVKRDYTDMVYPVTQGTNSARMSVSQIMAEIRGRNAGYGMQLYSGKDWAGTSTYDESLSTPGKAPDDSSKLTQTDQTNPQKYANIVKFYEDKLTNPTQTKRDSYTRTPSPKEITIEHESGPKYKVKEWFISTQFKSATGSTPVYSQYKSSLPNTRTGTTTTTVTLTDTETTLYVLLEKVAGISSGESSDPDDPYTLTESQISKLATADNPAEGVELSTQSFIINHKQLDNEHKITKPCDCPGPGSCRHGWYEYCGKEHKCPVKGTGCTGTAKNHCPISINYLSLIV